MIAVGAFAFGLGSNAFSIAQNSSNFEKKNFNYNEWTKGKFMEQCRYAYMKIKKLLDMQGATMNDVVRIMTYTTDVRFFQDALKCRAEAFGSAPIPASTLAWPNMAIEVDITAMLAR